ncbi:MAG: phage portal protein [Planctomycetaceae bacterium]|nr:phage portal protein [Planctomycetaceae bacterium]
MFQQRSGIIWNDALLTSKSASGVRVTEKSTLSDHALFRAIDLVSNRIAELDFFPYDRKGAGKEKAINHPAFFLLRGKPNNKDSWFDLAKQLMQDRLIHGNGYLWIEKLNSEPVGLHRLDPSKTFPVIEDGELMYGSVIANEPVKFFAHEVFHIKGLGDGLQGYSLIELMRDCIGSHVAKTQYTATFFSNGGVPTYAIKLPNALTPDARKSFKNEWAKIHSGSTGSRVAMLPFGFELQTYGFSPEQVELFNSKQFDLIEAANLIGIPASYLGSSQNTSYGSLEAESKSFLSNSLNAHLCAIEAQANLKLRTEKQIREDSVFFEFDRKKLDSTDYDKLIQSLAKQKEIGIITTNEFRKAINLPPATEEDADMRTMQVNMGFVDDMRNKTKTELQKMEMEIEKLKQPEPKQEPVMVPPAPQQEPQQAQTIPTEQRHDERLELVTRQICERMAARVKKAIENKGEHNLTEAHARVIIEQLKTINKKADELVASWLEPIQEELRHATRDKVRVDANKLFEVIL